MILNDRHVRKAHSQAGKYTYMAMLIVACVALAIAITFPVYEYIVLYHGVEDSGPDTVAGTGAAEPEATPVTPAPDVEKAEEAKPEAGKAPTAPEDAPKKEEAPEPAE